MVKMVTALAAALTVMMGAAIASPEGVAPRKDGQGPYDRLVIRGATMIDGSGAPPFGPVDIVIEGNRIASIKAVGAPGLPIDETDRPPKGAREIDATGKFVLPGFINLHGHIHSYGTGQDVPPDYIFKLWLMHGVTTVREVGNDKGAAFSVDLKRASARNEIDAPRLYIYPFFGSFGSDEINTPDAARRQIRAFKSAGADGVKFFSGPAEILAAAFEAPEPEDDNASCAALRRACRRH